MIATLTPARTLVADAIAAARPQPRRSYRRFLEADFVPPRGQFAGDPFRVANQPCLGPLIDAIDDDRWQTIVVTGPSQSGKTLVGFVGLVAWHLVELREDVVVGVPDMNMARDKWTVDLLPAFKASPKVKDLLPKRGAGAGGGMVDDLVQLGNGTFLKMMSPGGRDQRRAGYTTRVVGITELAGFNVRTETSKEAGPLKQILARQRGHTRASRRIYLEGTLTTDDEMPATLAAGSAVALLRSPCPHCAAWIHPEREHLVGWDGAETAKQASEQARFACPECGQLIDEDERRASVRKCRVFYDTADGITEDPPAEFDRLYYRWSAWDNLLIPLGDVAADEWDAAQLEDGTVARDDAERELCQFVWAIAYRQPTGDVTRLTAHQVRSRRVHVLPRNIAPEDTEWLTLGVDLGKFTGHLVLIAWRGGGRAHVVDYDTFQVPTASTEGDPGMDVQAAIVQALWGVHGRFAGGVPKKSGGVVHLDRVLVDAGYQGEAVYEFVRQVAHEEGTTHQATAVWLPCLGLGTGQHHERRYSQPKQRNKSIRAIGDRFFLSRNRSQRVWLVELDADHWKSWLHDRLAAPAGQRGALELFAGTEHTHRVFSRQLTAESWQLKLVPGVGMRKVWTNERSAQNHYFDAANYASVGGSLAGFSVVEASTTPRQQQRPVAGRWWNR